MDFSSVVQISLSYSFTAESEAAVCLVKTQQGRFSNTVTGRMCPELFWEILKGGVQSMCGWETESSH